MIKYFFLFIVCFVILIIHILLSGHGIYGDGNGFYVYTQALYFDKGLTFDPIYNHLEHFQGVKGEFSRIFWDRSFNPFPIGTGIIWIPSVAIISLFARDRFSLIYEVGPGLTGILLVLGGLYFMGKYLQNFFSKKIAGVAVFFLFFASNLFYYSSFEPALSHQPAFFIISFLLWKTYKMKQNILDYFIVGALSGILFITRIPDSILLLPIFWQLFKHTPKAKNWIALSVAGIIFTLPLFLSYQIMFGNPFHVPYFYGGDVGSFSFSLSKIVEFFFSAKRGLFTWTPIYLIGIFGLIRSHKYIVLVSLTVLFLVSSFWSANTSAGFGQRFVLSAIPYFTLGLGKLIEKINIKYIFSFFTVLLIWNFLTLFQFYFNSINLIRNENLSLNQFLYGQIQTPVKVFGDVKRIGIKEVFRTEVLD